MIGVGEGAQKPAAGVDRMPQGLSLKLQNTEEATAQGFQLTHALAIPMPAQVSE